VILGVGVGLVVTVGVGVGVGVGAQQLQLEVSPIKFQIGGALHWQTSLMPVIISPFTHEILIDADHLFKHDNGPV
jgi:hypothetical protein